MQYISRIKWQRGSEAFEVKTYPRQHQVSFGGGTQIEASSAPEFLGNAKLVNPEELFTASISSCFMLTFLYWAAMKGVIVNDYQAEVVGTLSKNAEGKMAVTEVLIKPIINFSEDKKPSAQLLNELFEKAHANCFISNSVKTAIHVEMPTTVAAS